MNIRTDADREMVNQLERLVKDLSRHRALLLKTELMTEEEMTEFINEKGKKYGDQ